jgi:hypothetical protein
MCDQALKQARGKLEPFHSLCGEKIRQACACVDAAEQSKANVCLLQHTKGGTNCGSADALAESVIEWWMEF